MGWMQDETGLEKNHANYVSDPLSTLRRAAMIYANELAVVYGTHRKTHAEYIDRCTRLAGLWHAAAGDVVSTVIPNLPAQTEAHFGVPACGAVLNNDQHPAGC